jgi:hypothetical protein
MPRIRVSLITIGLILTLSLLTRVSESQVDPGQGDPTTGAVPVEEPKPAPAPDPAPSAPPPATAEEPTPGESGPGPRPMDTDEVKDRIARMDLAALLEIPQIAEELKVTERQQEQLKAAGEANSQYRRQVLQEMQQGGGAADPGAMRQTMAALQEQRQAALAGVLTSAQKNRLRQIVLQARGALSVGEPDLAAQLRLTDLQVQQIQGVLQQMQAELSQIDPARRALTLASRDPGEDPPTDAGQAKAEGESAPGANSPADATSQAGIDQEREKAREIKEKAIQAIGRILSAAQRNSFNRMIGAPFRFEGIVVTNRGGFNDVGRGGRGGGRGNGGGPGGSGPGGAGGPRSR